MGYVYSDSDTYAGDPPGSRQVYDSFTSSRHVHDKKSASILSATRSRLVHSFAVVNVSRTSRKLVGGSPALFTNLPRDRVQRKYQLEFDL
jgi:hypothetical protein